MRSRASSPVLLAALLLAGCGGEGSRAGDRIFSRVETGPFELAVAARGKVVPREQAIVTCPQGFWGVKVEEVAEEGTRVTTGEVVLTIDLDDHTNRLERRRRRLEKGRLDLASLEARQTQALAASEATLMQKEMSLSTAREKLGILLEGPPEAKIEAQRILELAGARFEERQREKLEQEEQLRARGFTSELAYVEARGELEKAALRKEAAAAERRRLEGGPREEERSKLVAEEAMLALETRQTRAAHESQGTLQGLEYEEQRLSLAGQEGGVKREEKRLARGRVEAPTSGVVLHSMYGVPGLRVEAGGQLWSNQEVLRIVRLDRFEVEARVGERAVDRVEVGAPARLRFPALPGVELVGEVLSVGKFAVPVVGGSKDGVKEFEVKILLPAEAAGLKPNLGVHAEIRFGEVPGGWRVVHEAAACPPDAGPCRVETEDGRVLALEPAARDDEFVYFPGEPPAARVRLHPGGEDAS